MVERTTGLAAGYAGFLLRELGADVIRLEAAATTRAHPGEHVIHRGKRSADLPLAVAVRGADVVLTDGGDLPDHPGAIGCRIRAWGATGPCVGLPPDAALLAAATGLMGSQWSWSGRPVWLVTPMIDYMTGILAALGVTAAVFARDRGAGVQDVTVSGLQGALALMSGTYVTSPGAEGTLLAHGDPRGLYPNYGLYPTADGWLLVGALTQAFWVKLLTTLDRLDLLADPRLQGDPLTFGRPEVRAFVRTELEPVFRTRTSGAWQDALRAADVPCGIVASHAAVLDDPEARALGLVVDVDDPLLGKTRQPAAPALFSDTPLALTAAAPVPGADTAAVAREVETIRSPRARTGDGPATCLEGVRVLDVSSFIAGPFGPMLLADLGADVVKVESLEGDPFRMAAFGFVGWNRGKRSIAVDLKHPDGRDVFHALARGADVLVDNLRAGVLDRLGVGWSQLAAANPRLVHISVTGFGLDGPLAALPGFDPVMQARGGLMRAQGGADEPVFHTVPYNDYCAGALAALTTVAALVARERTGRGQRVDVSLFRTALIDQAAVMIACDGPAAALAGGRDFLGPSAARRLYECADGWVAIGADARARAALARVVGASLGTNDAADGPMARAIERWCAARPRGDALAVFEGAGVPAVPCLGVADVFDDLHLVANGAFVELDDQVLGSVTVGGPLLGLSGTPIRYRRSAPPLGAHGREILREAGIADARIAALIQARVVRGDG